MNRNAETVPAHHETPDLAELRRLAENATPGPWTFEAPVRFEVPIERELCSCSGVGDEYEFVSETADGHVHLWRESHIIYAGENVVAGNYDCEDGGILERRDRDYIAAASPAVVLGLLDRLAHMTEARDNARAEVKRLTAKLDAIEADGDKLSIMFGWLVYDVGEHTCGGYGPESGYAHEPGCGFEPVLRLDKLEGWPGEKPLDWRADS